MVGLAGFEPAASSSRTIYRFYQRERKVTEKNGVYRGKCGKMRENRHFENGDFPALEPENGKKKPHGGHVRGHVNGIPRPLRSCEFDPRMPTFWAPKTAVDGPNGCPSVPGPTPPGFSSKSRFQLQAVESRSLGKITNFMKHNR